MGNISDGIDDEKQEDGLNNKESEKNCTVRYEGGRYYFIARVCLLGETGVGKTCLVIRHKRSHFEETLPTIGVGYTTSSVQLDYLASNYQVDLRIWDTAGQERYRGFASMYYREASTVIIVYDVTNSQTLQLACNFAKEVIEKTGNSFCFIVGNKCDLRGVEDYVPEEKAGKYIKKECNNDRVCFFGEVSAKTGERVKELFETVSKKYVEVLFKERGVSLNQIPPPKKVEEENEGEGEEEKNQSQKVFLLPPPPPKAPDDGVRNVLMDIQSKNKQSHEITMRSSKKHVPTTGRLQIAPNFLEIEEEAIITEYYFFKRKSSHEIAIPREVIHSIISSERTNRFLVTLKNDINNKNAGDQSLENQYIFECEDPERFKVIEHEFFVSFKEITRKEIAQENCLMVNIEDTYQRDCQLLRINPNEEISDLLSFKRKQFTIRKDDQMFKNYRNHLISIFSALTWSGTIRIIDFSNLQLSSKELSFLFEKCLAANSRQITDVKLNRNKSIGRIIPNIHRLFLQGKLRIQYLSLRSSELGDKNVTTLLCSLLKVKYLQILDLSENNLTDEINIELGHVLRHQNSLQEINLEHNQIHTPERSNRRIKLKYQGNPCYESEKLGFGNSTLSPQEEFILDISEFDFHEDDVIYTSPDGQRVLHRGSWNGSEVVIKKMYVQQVYQKNFLKKEALISFGLNHPAVINTYGIILQPKSVSIVLESKETDLFKFIHHRKSNKGFKWPDKMRIIREIISGMMYLHSKKIVHLDLKPANCLCSHQGRSIQITDFGFSERKEMTISSFSLYDLNARGTSIYIAPESFKEGRKYGKKSDVFSFGVMLYEIVFEKLPYFDRQFKDPEDAARTICEKGIRPTIQVEMIENLRVSEGLDKGVVEEVVGVMEKCWEEDKTKRPEFCDILKFFSQKKKKKKK